MHRPSSNSSRHRYRREATADGSAKADPGSPKGVTDLLRAWSSGDHAALEALLPIVYGELRRQARRALQREAVGHTLQPTALVHEVYLRLVDQHNAQWESRSQFFAVAAQAMRRVLVDQARARRAAKRGGGARRIALTDADPDAPGAGASSPSDIDVLALNDALNRLAEIDPRKARLVEARYFGGLSIPEAAAAVGVSPATAGREWSVARLWLRRELGG